MRTLPSGSVTTPTVRPYLSVSGCRTVKLAKGEIARELPGTVAEGLIPLRAVNPSLLKTHNQLTYPVVIDLGQLKRLLDLI